MQTATEREQTNIHNDISNFLPLKLFLLFFLSFLFHLLSEFLFFYCSNLIMQSAFLLLISFLVLLASAMNAICFYFYYSLSLMCSYISKNVYAMREKFIMKRNEELCEYVCTHLLFCGLKLVLIALLLCVFELLIIFLFLCAINRN